MNQKTALREKLGNLTPEQRQQLMARLDARKDEKSHGIPVANERMAPLSFAQARLWLMDQVEGAHYKYNMVSAYRFKGQLNVDHFQRAFALIIDRHTTLKSRFRTLGDDVVQEIIPDFSFELPCEDLRNTPEPERNDVLKQALLAESRYRFDMAAGPLFHFKLYRLTNEEYVLQLNVHHAIFDGRSKGILFSELAAIYNALASGEEPELEPLTVQYSDFSRWQRTHLATEIESQLNEWRAILADAPPLIDLPLDFPRPTAQTSEADYVKLFLEPEVFQRLKQVGQRFGTTPFMTLLAVFKVLVHRYTGATDLSIGTPVDNRSRSEICPLIGFFLNTVILRTQLRDDMSFGEVLRTVKQNVLKAFRNQDVPFEQVVEAVNPVRSQSYTPLNQVLFVFQHSTSDTPQFHGLDIDKVLSGNLTTKSDLYLTFKEERDGLMGLITYRKDLFRHATIGQLAAHFQLLITELAEDPGQRLRELSLVKPEKAATLHRLGQGETLTLVDTALAEALLCVGEARADHPQVCEQDHWISAAELWYRAAAVARHLTEAGLRPGDVVGLRAPRGVAMIAALLGIWLRGGIAMPIDHRHPEARVRGFVAASGARWVLNSETDTCQDQVPERNLEEILATSEASPARDWLIPVPASAPALLLHTSGSTGKPKAVMVRHDTLANRASWEARHFHDEATRCCHRAGIGFVDAYAEILGALLHGRPLLILDEDIARDPFELVDQLEAYDITQILLVPSLLRELIAAYPDLGEKLPSLKTVYSSGEPLLLTDVQRFYAALPIARLVNVYGSSELPDISAVALEADAAHAHVSIGRALDNVNVYVCDLYGQPSPLGVVGNLWVESLLLSPGYAGAPSMTAERFLPCPFSDRPGARMYRTGDRVRLADDGQLHYVGRDDHQVSLRGFRIELGEIEGCVECIEGVQNAAVVVTRNSRGDEVLAAYIQPEEDARLEEWAVREQLRQTLPDYMLPNAVKLMAQLPVSIHGKVDRMALAAQGLPKTDADAYVAPATELEQALTEIWAELLRLPQVSVTANLFELGGHSLIAVRMSAQIHDRLGYSIQAQELFTLSTIRRIASHLEAVAQVAGEGEGMVDDDMEITEF